LEHAVREEVLARNVAKLVQVGVPRRVERKPLTVDEAKRLLKCARDHRLYAMFVVTLLLGLRRGEVLGLRWEDVDLDARVLHVRQTLQRVGGQLRYLPPTVPLLSICVAALRDRLPAQSQERLACGPEWPNSGLVFTTRRARRSRRGTTRVTFGRCVSALAWRPFVYMIFGTRGVSLLLALGTDPRTVMEIVGHSALDMTMNVYGHVELRTRREALDRLDDLLDE
jgi:integrase